MALVYAVPLLCVCLQNFVDLAGSENVKESGLSGKRRVEAGVINRSLLALAVLINQLNSGVYVSPVAKNKFPTSSHAVII